MQLAKRDVDLNRVRENRDTLQAELHDKKILMQAQGDGQRLAKNLANTRYVGAITVIASTCGITDRTYRKGSRV